MNFKQAVHLDNSKPTTRTTNGMAAYTTSSSPLVDLFNAIGSSRGVDVADFFYAAMEADADKAIRILLWSRDVLLGAGEREQFRGLLKIVEEYSLETATKLIPKIPEIGRWDDMFYFQNPVMQSLVFDYYGRALKQGNALAAKWAPREKSAKREIAYAFRKHLKLTPKQYRKLLVSSTDVVENKMCANKWEDINFSHVPSVASLRYQAAFQRHVPEKYEQYTDALVSGDLVDGKEVKVNAKAVYPHDVVLSILRGHDNVAYSQWESLPDYVGDAKIFPLVDVSGSMGVFESTSSLEPIHVAISLGLYLADKNSSDFKDIFLTFTSYPDIVELKGDLKDKINQMNNAEWGMSTDISRAFSKILQVACDNKVSPSDMPEVLLILSDMQFDIACDYNDTALQVAKKEYAAAGYDLPRIVFWNLSDNTTNIAVGHVDSNTAAISGFNTAILKSVLADNLEEFTPESVMMEAIMLDRYKL